MIHDDSRSEMVTFNHFFVMERSMTELSGEVIELFG